MAATEYRPLLRGGGGPPSDSEHSDIETQEDSATSGLPSTANGPAFGRVMSFTENVTPEWAVLLLGCALGLATGASVVLFNLSVHGIHSMAWAGTPAEGAAWLRTQPLATTWHRIMLIPVLGGVVVGMLHALTGIIEQSQGSALPSSAPPGRQRLDWGAASRPVIKAVQAAVTLGTGSSLGPEGPSVDIGKSWADGMAEILTNTRERKIALLAAGAAAGIASGFNAAVAGCFFAIETVLQPNSSEHAPPLTTAMIILASVLSSTVSTVVLGEEPAFTVPDYELRSAAELPLYLLLGMVCGIISVILTRLIKWSTALFDFARERLGVPAAVTPALGGLCVGFIALQYPGVLYWGFSNVNEILHSRQSASAPGPKLMTQLIAAKILATALCRGSGLVGGIYAPSLFIGSAVGSVYGSLAGAAINAAVPGRGEVAAPQAYALVGMAAMLASVCSVPLTSVLLLFELTKDYHILLPLMGAVGLAYWVSSVANRKKAPQPPASRAPPMGANGSIVPYSPLVAPGSHSSGRGGGGLQQARRAERASSSSPGVELSRLADLQQQPDEELLDDIKVAVAMSSNYVKVQASATVKEAVAAMLEGQQACALVVDEDDLLEGIMTLTDLQREAIRAAEAASQGDTSGLDVDTMLVASVCSAGKGAAGSAASDLVVCFPDQTLRVAQRLMAPRGLHQLPVVSRGGKRWQDRGRKLVGLLRFDKMRLACQAEATKRILAYTTRGGDDSRDEGSHGSHGGH
eukprot:jgi/Mesen1/5838/ME000297S05026